MKGFVQDIEGLLVSKQRARYQHFDRKTTE